MVGRTTIFSYLPHTPFLHTTRLHLHTLPHAFCRDALPLQPPAFTRYSTTLTRYRFARTAFVWTRTSAYTGVGCYPFSHLTCTVCLLDFPAHIFRTLLCGVSHSPDLFLPLPCRTFFYRCTPFSLRARRATRAAAREPPSFALPLRTQTQFTARTYRVPDAARRSRAACAFCSSVPRGLPTADCRVHTAPPFLVLPLSAALPTRRAFCYHCQHGHFAHTPTLPAYHLPCCCTFVPGSKFATTPTHSHT